MNKKALLIDGNQVLRRAFHSAEHGPQLKTSSGENTTTLNFFLNILFSKLGNSNQKYDYIVVAFDKGKNTIRHREFDDYKATRDKTPSELINQFILLKKFLTDANILWFESEDYEADDIIGTLVKKYENKFDNIEIEILSNDKDLYQLISNKTSCVVSKKYIKNFIYNLDEFKNNYDNLSPEQIPDLKGITGDSSDNLPGVKGIGEKGAIELLKKYSTLENIYNNLEDIKKTHKEKLIKYKEAAFLSKKLATIYNEVPLDDVIFDNIDINFENIINFLDEYELKRMKISFMKLFDIKTDKKDIDIEFKILNKWEKKYESDNNYIWIESDDINYHKANIIGVGISNDKGNFYLDFSNKKVNKQLSFFNVVEEDNSDNILFFNFLKNKNIKKYTFDIKKSLFILNKDKSNFKISFSDFDFDFMIASYCIDSTFGSSFSQQLNIIFNEFIYEDEIIYGKNYKLLDKLSLEEKSKFICTKSSLLKKYSNKIIEKLKNNNQYLLYKNIDHPLINTLYEIEKTGILIDKKELELQTEDIFNKIKILEKNMKTIFKNEIDTEINFNSPKQVQELLFNTLKLKNNRKKSTSKEHLEQLKDEHEIVNMLLEYRKLNKLYSTYLLGFEKYIFPDNKIHTIFNQALTNTGRLSSNEPNIQNITIKDDDQRKVRKIFISKDNTKFYSYDYSQIELRVLTQFSKDKKLIEIFNNNIDVHDQTARFIFKLDKNEVVDPYHRRVAKVFNFGILYGLTPYGLSQDLNIDIPTAKMYIDQYFAVFDNITKFRDEQVDFAKRNGYAITLSNRRRLINELKSVNKQIKEFGNRIAINMPIQGTASDILKVAMNQIQEKFTKHNLKSKIVAQIHDELIFEIHDEENNDVKKIIESEMRNAFSKMFELLNINDEIVVDLKLNKNHGTNWFELK